MGNTVGGSSCNRGLVGIIAVGGSVDMCLMGITAPVVQSIVVF